MLDDRRRVYERVAGDGDHRSSKVTRKGDLEHRKKGLGSPNQGVVYGQTSRKPREWTANRKLGKIGELTCFSILYNAHDIATDYSCLMNLNGVSRGPWLRREIRGESKEPFRLSDMWAPSVGLEPEPSLSY